MLPLPLLHLKRSHVFYHERHQSTGTRGFATAISTKPPGGGAVPGAIGEFVDIPTTQIRKVNSQCN